MDCSKDGVSYRAVATSLVEVPPSASPLSPMTWFDRWQLPLMRLPLMQFPIHLVKTVTPFTYCRAILRDGD